MRKNKTSGCDGAACCLGCLSLIPGVRKRLVSRAAFFPPSPPGYFIVEDSPRIGTAIHTTVNATADEKKQCDSLACELMAASQLNCNKREKHVYLSSPWGSFGQRATHRPRKVPSIDSGPYGTIYIRHVEIPSRHTSTIHSFLLTRHDATHTILFSHGNSTDIGLMFPHFLELCRHIPVNLIGYDFSGYGASCGIPTELGLYSDIASVFEFLTGPQFNILPSRLVLYGQSVGSAPTLDLASKVSNLAGVIIHSGMKSGFTVVKPNYETIHWFDAFKNIQKIKQVKAPIFIIHGTHDSEVKIEHGKSLYDAALNARCWWVQGAGHNDIEVLHRSEYFSKISEFLEIIGGLPTKGNSLDFSSCESTGDEYSDDISIHPTIKQILKLSKSLPTFSTDSLPQSTVSSQHEKQHRNSYQREVLSHTETSNISPKPRHTKRDYPLQSCRVAN